MGVNLHLVHDDPGKTPPWDPWVNGGAKTIYQNLGRALPVEYLDDDLIRPSDFAVWRAFVSVEGFPNSQRYLDALEHLERDSRLFILISA